jgi:hypothetical protein
VKNIIKNSLNNKKTKEPAAIKDNALNDSRTFILAALAIALLTGLVIPSGVVSSGVEEFSYSADGELVSPLRFVVHTALQAGGFFLWGICLYFLFQGKARVVLTTAAVSLLIMSVMDTFVYWRDYGFLTQELVLSNYFSPGSTQQNITLAVIIALSATAFFLMSIRQKQLIISLLFITVISFALLSLTDIVKTNAAFADVKKHGIKNNSAQIDTVEKVFKLSKKGKNIIVLMLDMAQSQHIPFIFEEKPRLLKSFHGFTYYPNMVSFGGSTFYGAPALFGGYYYTPAEMQKRTEQKLNNKYNEAMQVLPRIMAQNGFDVSVSNLPFTDASEAFAKQIFADAENINATDIIDKYIDRYYRGRLPIANSTITVKDYNHIVKKNLFQFSLVKCSPFAMRTKVYNNGGYMNVDNRDKNFTGNYSKSMLQNYFSLLLYPQMTQFTDDDVISCVIADNDLTHASCFLQYPDYEPIATVTNRGDGLFSNNPQYHAAMLCFLLLSKWLDELKENNVWDNTRIIIMSDHGNTWSNNNIPANIALPGGDKLQKFNNLLMVKDFGAAKEFSVDSSFMTSADIPAIAVKNIIDNPVNPFTKEPLYTDKNNGVIITTANWKPKSKHGEYNYNIKNNEYLKVKDNVFKRENWTKHSVEN